MNWKIDTPATVGLHIASANRDAGFVRYWTGKHWTAPVAVHNMHLRGRVPNETWGPTDVDEPIEWLEPYEVDADGWTAWGGLVERSPVRSGLRMRLLVRVRGARAPLAGDPAWFRWRHEGNGCDIVAYRLLDEDPAPLGMCEVPSAGAGERLARRYVEDAALARAGLRAGLILEPCTS